ncbi:cupredoxin domain-containing protein [Candidatus Woesearchaeota archaeon]|nr:cupredoxin domain-containing protein [Candidatus Woesearchaeota archaeon]
MIILVSYMKILGLAAVLMFIIFISGCVSSPTGSVILENVDEETPERSIEEVVAEENLSEEQEEIVEEILEKQEEASEGIKKVEMKNLKFDPAEVTVKKGTTVIWQHNDQYNDRSDIKHLISAFYGKFRSPTLYYGDSYNFTFNEAGEFGYIDIVYKETMRGKITVTD